MRKFWFCCIIILLSILTFAQQPNLVIQGPSSTSGPVTITIQINAPASCNVTILPTSVSIQTSNTQQFTFTALGCSPSTVTWQVNGVTGGDATHGTITVGGLYTAPASVPTPATVTVTAVSNADNTKTASSSVTITSPPPPCSVNVSPTSATVQTTNTQQFTATTQGCSPSTVTWNVNSVVGGNSTVGTVSGTGLYTAPANVPTPSIVTVQAVSNADNTKTASASVTVIAPAVCSVSVVPQVVSLITNATQQLTATTTNCTPSTVTWDVNTIVGGNSTVGTISAGGLYTAPATVPSPATVTARAVSNADNTKTASSSITISTPSIANNDKYCAVGNVPSFGVSDSYAALPITCYYTNPATINPSGTVRSVTSNATWTSAWSAAVCGDIVEVASGTTLTNVTIPTKNCGSNYIWLRSSGYASLPGYGTKMSPCYAGVASLPGRPSFNCHSLTVETFKITTTSTAAPLTISTGTTGIKITGAEITRNSGTGTVFQLFALSGGGSGHLILDHIWCHGDTTDETTVCINVNTLSYFAMTDSFISDIFCVSVTGSCTDSHAIAGGTNASSTDHDNTIKAVNNYLEAAGQCMLFGGGTTTNNITDMEFRNNYCFKPLTWDPSDASYNGGIGGHGLTVKNCFELKTGVRVLFEGNVCQNIWGGFSQVGNAITITPKNQAGSGGSNICPLCAVTDVTVRYNYITTIGQAFQIANIASDNGGYAAGGNHYSFHDNLFDNINYPSCFGCTSATNELFEDHNIPTADILHHVDLNHNTLVRTTGGSTPGVMVDVAGATIASGLNADHMNFTNNVMMYGQFFGFTVAGSGSTDCNFNKVDATGVINSCWTNFTVGGNAFINNRNTITWPGTNCLSVTTQTAMFVNYNNGFNGDYTITSPCHNTATDGKDPGADLTKVASYTNGVTTF